MLDEILLKRLDFSMLLVEMLLVFFLIAHTYPRFRRQDNRDYLFVTFVVFLIYLVAHTYNVAADALLMPWYRSEVLEVICHTFRTLFFIIFAFLVLSALVNDKLLRKIVKANTVIIITLILLFTMGMLIEEGGELLFYYTNKEFMYEIFEITANIIVVSITYFAWMETKSKGMLFILLAFIFFFISNLGHMYSLVWARSYTTAEIIEPLIKDFFSMTAIALLVYAYRHRD